MNSKMREALQEAWLAGCGDEEGITPAADDYAVIDRIVQRYGDLEFTREEVRGMLKEAAQKTAHLIGRNLVNSTAEKFANEILARHTEAEDTCTHCGVENGLTHSVKCPNHISNVTKDDTPTITASEIEAVTGEELPEEMRWAFKNPPPSNEHFIAPEYPKPDGNNAGWLAPGWNYATGLYIPGPWDRSLRRIIHDEPETVPVTNLFRVEKVDREVGELHGELIVLTKRVATLEKALLARGHAETCVKRCYVNRDGSDPECTCHYDEVREKA